MKPLKSLVVSINFCPWSSLDINFSARGCYCQVWDMQNIDCNFTKFNNADWRDFSYPEFLAGISFCLRILTYRSNHPKVLLRKGVLKIYSKFILEHPYRSAISIKLFCSFIEIALRHGCSPANLLHTFRTPFHKNTYGWLLLSYNFISFVGSSNLRRLWFLWRRYSP